MFSYTMLHSLTKYIIISMHPIIIVYGLVQMHLYEFISKANAQPMNLCA